MRKSHAFTSYSYHLAKPVARTQREEDLAIEYLYKHTVNLSLS